MSRFPSVNLIVNEENVGFPRRTTKQFGPAKAAMLLLNPDTVVREDTLSSCLAWMDPIPRWADWVFRCTMARDGSCRNPSVAPTPWAAFCRMAGFHGSPQIPAIQCVLRRAC